MAVVLTGELLESVGVISAEMRSRFATGGDTDIGFVAMATLRHLVRHGPRSITALAKSDRVTTQAISIRLAPLLEAGLVVRMADPTDGRRASVEVTKRGREAVTRAQERARNALESAVGDLTPAEKDALAEALPVLQRLGAHLSRENP
jgi:DNA-binding MarR family transcriptional regulator